MTPLNDDADILETRALAPPWLVARTLLSFFFNLCSTAVFHELQSEQADHSKEREYEGEKEDWYD